MKSYWVVFLSLFMFVFTGAREGVCAQEKYSLVYPFASEEAYTDVWPLSYSYGGHQGVDYACPAGTPVYASISGTVITAYDAEVTKSCIAYGNNIIIQEDRQGGCTVRYAHLQYNSIPFEVGDHVYAGELVGLTSNTGDSGGTVLGPDGTPICVPGTSNGNHLHYEVRCDGSAGLNPYAFDDDANSADDHMSENKYEAGQDMFMIDSDGSFHFPQEPFFERHDVPMVCANQPTPDGSWYYTCSKERLFEEGEHAWILLRLHGVQIDHRFRVKAYKDDAYQWEWTTNPIDVGSSTWQYSHFWPEFMDALPGKWRFDLFFIPQNGSEAFVDTTSLRVFPHGTFHMATNPPGENYYYDRNGYICPGPIEGGASTNWVYTCGIPRTSFVQGETVNALVRIDDITSDFRFSVNAYKDGAYQWNSTGGWNDVGQWGWSKSYFPITMQNAQPGNWEFRVSVDEGGGFELLDTLSFVVSPSPPYQYSGLVTCSGPVTGGAETNWEYTCQNPVSSFSSGQTAIALVRIDNISADFRWKQEVYINGAYQWNWITDWNDVGQWGWSKSYFTPTTSSVWPGNWEYRIFLDTGSGFQYLDSAYFTVN